MLPGAVQIWVTTTLS